MQQHTESFNQSKSNNKELRALVNETIINTYERTYVVLDDKLKSVLVKGSLKPYFDLSRAQLNEKPLRSQDSSLQNELTALFSQVKIEQKGAKGIVIPFHFAQDYKYVQLEIKPLLYPQNGNPHYLLEFHTIDPNDIPFPDKELLKQPEYHDSLRIHELEQELERSKKHLEMFSKELEAKNQLIQSMNEELQASNQELRSSNDELETSNEELQSINEELQTTNTNLNVVNGNFIQQEKELKAKHSELEALNQRFETVLENSKIFVAYQDLELRYVWFNNLSSSYNSEDVLGISDYELFRGKSAYKSLMRLKEEVLKTEIETEEEVFLNGKFWSIKVKPWVEKEDLVGVIVLSIDITEERNAYKKLELRGGIIDALTAASKDYLLIVDLYSNIHIISEPLCEDISKSSGLELKSGDSLAERMQAFPMLQKQLMEPIRKALEGKQTRLDQFVGFASVNSESQKLYALQVSPIKGNKDLIIGAEFRGTEITDLVNSKLRVQNTLKRGAHLIEEEYFKDLTLQMYELFNSKSTYVGVLSEDKASIITKAIRIDGKLSSNFLYDLNEVPCEVVQLKDEIQHYAQVLKHFPTDPKLQRWNAVDYVGVPISSPLTGEMLGILVVINDEPIALNPDLQYLLTILSLRAGAELLRQQSTKQLEDKEQQFENITRNSPGVIWEFRNLANGEQQFSYLSASSVHVLELMPQQIINNPQSFFDLIHPDDQESFFEYHEHNLSSPKSTEWVGRIITARSHLTKWIKISAQPDILENGDVIWYGIIDDINHQKEIEHALKIAKEEAEAAASAKDDFLATMSHEIRTPLNAIYGISELLRMNEHTKQMEEVELLQYSSENLLSLVNNILDFSKLKAGKLAVSYKPFDLKQLFVSITKSTRFLAKRSNTKFVLEFDSSIPEDAIGDELILSQILHNLLSNANKFTHDGLITLKAQLKENLENAFSIVVSVIDTGEGISERDIHKIFSKFEQSEHDIASKGTGLGLTITKALLNLLESDIIVESKKGEGSTFSFELELGKDSREQISSEINSEEYQHCTGKKIKVLMVEDNDDNRLLVSKYFDKLEHIQIEMVSNGEASLELLKHHTYNVVLMDLRMPIMNGWEASKRIRAMNNGEFNELPIIALTADTYGVPKDTEFTDVLTKPFKFKDLVKLIEKHGSQSI